MAEPTLYSILESRRIAKSALEQKCTEKHLATIAQSITSWKEVCPFLGLTQQDEENIESDNKKNADCKVAMMRRWSKVNGEEATYFNLAEAFECVKWRDCIYALLDLFEESLSSPQSAAGRGGSSSSEEGGKQSKPSASPLGKHCAT